MDHLLRTRENIDHFRRQLATETSRDLRRLLQGLLVDEEDKLGASMELLEDIEQAIKEGEARIERQKTLIQDLERNGHDTSVAGELLVAFSDLSAFYARYRHKLADVLAASDRLSTVTPPAPNP